MRCDLAIERRLHLHDWHIQAGCCKTHDSRSTSTIRTVPSSGLPRGCSKRVFCQTPRFVVAKVVLPVVNVIGDEFASFLYTPLHVVKNVCHSKMNLHVNEPPHDCQLEIRAFDAPNRIECNPNSSVRIMCCNTQSVHRCLPDCGVGIGEILLSVFA